MPTQSYLYSKVTIGKNMDTAGFEPAALCNHVQSIRATTALSALDEKLL